MKNDQDKIKKEKFKRKSLAAVIVLLIIAYATFAQPLAYNIAIKVKDKISDIIGIDDSNKNDNDNNSSDEDDGKDNNNNNIVSSNTNKNDNNGGNAGVNNNAQWNFSFTKVIKTEVVGGAYEVTPVTTQNEYLLGIFNVALTSPNDSITYEFTITNKGILEGKVSSINMSPENNDTDPILFHISGVDIGDTLKPGESTVVKVKVVYNKAIDFATVPKGYSKSSTFSVNYVQK